MSPSPLPQFAVRLFIGLTMLTPALARADWTEVAPSDFRIMTPPAPGSAEDRRDFDIMLKVQQTRSQADCAIGQKQSWPKVKSFWGDGSVLSESEYARAEKRLEKAAKVAERVADYYKKKIQRPRPYAADTRIHPCVSNPPTGQMAFPSSHAAIATATGCLLAQIYPEKRERILKSAEYFSNLRFIIGVHHPSDVEAGKRIGLDVCKLAR